MTVDLIRDEPSHCAFFAVEGAFDAEAWHTEVVERLWREDLWTYGLMYDLRRLTHAMTLFDVQNFLREGLRVPTDIIRGPIAVVAIDRAIYANACAFATLAGALLQVQVFSHGHEAKQWLKQQVARQRGHAPH